MDQLGTTAIRHERVFESMNTRRPPPKLEHSLCPSFAYKGDSPAFRSIQRRGTQQRNSRGGLCYRNPRPLPTNYGLPHLPEPEFFAPRQRRSAGEPSPRTSNPGDPVCWNCQKRGYRHRECPEPRHVFCYRCSKSGVTTQNCAFSRCCESLSEGRPVESFHPIVLASVGPSSTAFYVDTKVGKATVRALVDSGATKTFVGRAGLKFFADLGFLPYEVPVMRVLLAAVQVEHINYASTFYARLHDRETKATVFWMPTLAEDLILGMEFLQAARMFIDFHGQTWCYLVRHMLQITNSQRYRSRTAETGSRCLITTAFC